jgi:hypothetical protein
MTPAVRIGAAFVASLAAAGLVQQASMTAAQVREPLEALPPLALLVILLTAILALVAWRRPAAIGLAAGLLLTLLAVIGAGGHCLGLATLTPGVGGNILYLIARFESGPVFRKDHAPPKYLDHDPIQLEWIMV